MISNVHMRLIFKVSDDSCFDYPKYRTIDIPMSDRMIEIMAETKTTCALLVGGHVVQEDKDSYTDLATELERARADLAILREGYSDCIADLIDASQHVGRFTLRAERISSIVQRHRDILTRYFEGT